MSFACGLCLGLYPSTELVQFQKWPAPFPLPSQIHPGDPLFLPAGSSAQEIYLLGQKFSQIKETSLLLGVVGLKQQPQTVIHGILSVDRGRFLRFPTVNYFMETVDVRESNNKPPTPLRLPAAVWTKVNSEHTDQKERDRERMREIMRSRDGDLEKSCWQWPLRSPVVSRSASPRALPNGETYLHGGIDLRAATGTLVRASGDGKVVLAESMVVPGTVIVIQHGQGLFTRYMHLSEVNVLSGQWVKKGEIIGKSGATGRVEAPHLHWEVVWKGNSANPQEFLKAWEHICGQG